MHCTQCVMSLRPIEGTGCTEECSQLSAPEDKLEEGKEEDEEEESAPKRPRLSSTDLRPITRVW